MSNKTLPEAVHALQPELLNVYQATLEQAGELGVNKARSTTLFKHSDSFDNNIQFQATGAYQGTVESHAPYSQYLEYGNDPGDGVIYPTTANALHFFANGEEVFAKHVRSHKPLPFMNDAADAVENELPSLWTKLFDSLI